MKNKSDEWKWLKQAQNEIGNYLCETKSQGTVTIEQREDKFVLMAMIPKDGELKIDPDDTPRCRHLLG